MNLLTGVQVASPLSVSCPGCGASLKIKNEQAVGKRIACPLCTERFVVPARSADSNQAPTSPLRGASLPPDKPRKQAVTSRPNSPPPRPKRKSVPAEDDEFAALNEFDSFEEGSDTSVEDVSTQPRSSSSRRRTPAKRVAPAPSRVSSRNKSRGSKQKLETQGNGGKAAKWVLIGGGLLIGLSLMIAVVYVAVGTVSKVSQFVEKKKRSNFELTYLPKYTQKLTVVRVSELWQTPFIKSLAEDADFAAGIADFREKFGMGPEDIETFTFAGGPPPNLMGSSASKFSAVTKAASGISGVGEEHIAIVVRAKKPFDQKKVRSFIGMTGGRTHEGVDYMPFEAPRLFHSVEMAGGYFPNEKTLVLGTIRCIESVIDEKGMGPDCPEIDIVDSRHQILMAQLPKNVAFMGDPRDLQDPKKLELIKQMDPEMYLRAEFKVIASSLDFTDGLNFHYEGDCISEQLAKTTHEQLQSERNGKAVWTGPRVPVRVGYVRPPVTFVGMTDIENKLQSTATHQLNGTRFSASSSMTADDLDTFQAILVRLAPMALSGNFDKSDDLGTLVQLPSSIYRRKGSLVSAPTERFGQMFTMPALAAFAERDEEGEGEEVMEMAADEVKDAQAVNEAQPVADKTLEPNPQANVPVANPPPVDPAQVQPLIDALSARGVKVETGPQGDFRLLVDNPEFSDDDLQVVAQLPNVSMLVAFQSSVTDRGISNLAGLGETLKVLELFGATITSDGMTEIPFDKFTALRLLNLSDTKVSDANISDLEKIPSLELLVAQRAFFTNEARAHVLFRVIR